MNTSEPIKILHFLQPPTLSIFNHQEKKFLKGKKSKL